MALPGAALFGLTVLLAGLAYLRTVAPGVFTLDSPELTAGAFSLGIVHSPGDPVYLLAGHFFLKLPLGDVGLRMNLLSALAAVPQRILSAWGGVLAEALGWAPFFLVSTAAALPGLLLLVYLMRRFPLAEKSA